MNYIKERIDKSGYRYKRVAEKVGISATELSNYISEVRKPNQSRLLKLSNFLNCKESDLYPYGKKEFVIYFGKDQ